MSEPIKISKNYDSDFLTRPDVSFDDFITVYSDKVNGWYLDWAAYLNDEEHAGFAAVQIGFSYFEAIAIYKNGSGRVDNSGTAFKNEIKRLFGDDLINAGYDNSKVDKAFHLLWKEGRNGFFHVGMSRKGIALEDGVPTIRIKTQDIDASGNVTKVRIDRHSFVKRIKNDFKEYIDNLKNPANLTQRSKFRSSWNAINVIPIPTHL